MFRKNIGFFIYREHSKNFSFSQVSNSTLDFKSDCLLPQTFRQKRQLFYLFIFILKFVYVSVFEKPNFWVSERGL